MHRDPQVSEEQLARLPIFQGSPRNSLRRLLRHARTASIGEGQLLLSPERENDVLYLVLDGALQVRLPGQDEPLASLGPGHCVGELSVIEQEPPSALVFTETPCNLLMIEGATIRGLISDSHAVTKNLLRLLSARLRTDNRLISDSLEQTRRHERDAHHDPLTGLHNRRWLEHGLERLHHNEGAGTYPLSTIMVDIDHFKECNDRHGHALGDEVLVAVGDALLRVTRATDLLARYGGDEFVVLMPATDPPQALSVAERIQIAIRELRFGIGPERAPLTVTASLGIATSEDKESDSKTLLAAADTALYRAKSEGRNRVSIEPSTGPAA